MFKIKVTQDQVFYGFWAVIFLLIVLAVGSCVYHKEGYVAPAKKQMVASAEEMKDMSKSSGL